MVASLLKIVYVLLTKAFEVTHEKLGFSSELTDKIRTAMKDLFM